MDMKSSAQGLPYSRLPTFTAVEKQMVIGMRFTQICKRKKKEILSRFKSLRTKNCEDKQNICCIHRFRCI